MAAEPAGCLILIKPAQPAIAGVFLGRSLGYDVTYNVAHRVTSLRIARRQITTWACLASARIDAEQVSERQERSLDLVLQQQIAILLVGSCDRVPAVLYPSVGVASVTSPTAVSGMAVAAYSRTSSRALGISRAIASPLPTGKNRSRRPWTTSVGATTRTLRYGANTKYIASLMQLSRCGHSLAIDPGHGTASGIVSAPGEQEAGCAG
jgi:hypothetical protein